MAAADSNRSRKRGAATGLDERAAFGEGTARRQIGKLRNSARDSLEPCPLLRAETRAGAKQPLRIGMPHAREHLLGCPALDDRTAVHHHHPSDILGDDAKIV